MTFMCRNLQFSSFTLRIPKSRLAIRRNRCIEIHSHLVTSNLAHSPRYPIIVLSLHTIFENRTAAAKFLPRNILRVNHFDLIF